MERDEGGGRGAREHLSLGCHLQTAIDKGTKCEIGRRPLQRASESYPPIQKHFARGAPKSSRLGLDQGCGRKRHSGTALTDLGELPPESVRCRNHGGQLEDGLEDQTQLDRTIKTQASGGVNLCN